MNHYDNFPPLFWEYLESANGVLMEQLVQLQPGWANKVLYWQKCLCGRWKRSASLLLLPNGAKDIFSSDWGWALGEKWHSTLEQIVEHVVCANSLFKQQISAWSSPFFEGRSDSSKSLFGSLFFKFSCDTQAMETSPIINLILFPWCCFVS